MLKGLPSTTLPWLSFDVLGERSSYFTTTGSTSHSPPDFSKLARKQRLTASSNFEITLSNTSCWCPSPICCDLGCDLGGALEKSTVAFSGSNLNKDPSTVAISCLWGQRRASSDKNCREGGWKARRTFHFIEGCIVLPAALCTRATEAAKSGTLSKHVPKWHGAKIAKASIPHRFD